MRLTPRAVPLLAVALVALSLQAPAAGAAAPVHGLEGVPHFRHVVVLVLENENFDATWGPDSPAHYLNSLVPRGVFADQYFATGHASLDNYVAMVSGQPANPATSSDCSSVNLWTCVQAQQAMSGGRNLADQLDEAGVTWKGYMDSMPSPCFHADYSQTAGPDPYQGDSQSAPAGDYADRHDPFVYFDDLVSNDARCKAHVVPYTWLHGHLRTNRLPAFSFITPDTCHDAGRAAGRGSAAAWGSSRCRRCCRPGRSCTPSTTTCRCSGRSKTRSGSPSTSTTQEPRRRWQTCSPPARDREEFLDAVCGIPDSRSEIVMLKPPGDGTRPELARFVRPDSAPGSPAAMANELGLRNVAFEVNDLQAAVDWAATEGYGLVGGIGEYEGIWRMAYVRGPEGIIVSLAERLG